MLTSFSHPSFGPIKIGKRAKRVDTRTLQLRDYLPKAGQVIPAPPAAPAEVSWITKVPTPWNMYLNDQLGCCVESAMAHMVKQLTFFSGKPAIPADNDVLVAYEKIGGYVPGDPTTDQGSDMLTALNYWRQTGMAGHKITAFAEIRPGSLYELRQAIMLFGSAFQGVALPISAQPQSAWTVPNGGPFGDGSPGSWGGHCIPPMAQSPESISVITWGEILKQSHNFYLDYTDECYAVITQDWIEADGESPSGFDTAALLADLKQVTA